MIWGRVTSRLSHPGRTEHDSVHAVQYQLSDFRGGGLILLIAVAVSGWLMLLVTKTALV